jgi:hypothetical protein
MFNPFFHGAGGESANGAALHQDVEQDPGNSREGGQGGQLVPREDESEQDRDGDPGLSQAISRS